jgi:hypothetical protein
MSKNETNDRRPAHDQGLARVLRETLASDDRVPSSGCLDAEQVAAWFEGGLSRRDRAVAESHAAGCARCQAMLAVMAQTAPTDVATTRASAASRWMLMFGPALAAAAAVTLWFAVDQRRAPVASPDIPAIADSLIGPERDKSDRPVASPPFAAAAAKEAQQVLADEERRNERRPESSAHSMPQAVKNEVAAEKPAPSARPTAPATMPSLLPPVAEPAVIPPVGGLAETVNVRQSATGTADARQRAQSLPPPPPAAPLPPSQSQYAQQQAAQARQDQQQVNQAEQVSRDASAAGAGRGGGAGRGATAGARPAEIDQVMRYAVSVERGVFRAPDDSAWWQIINGRVVQQSTDRGVTWSTRYTAEETTFLTAGASPSSSICWVIGRAGVVLVSTEGGMWRRVAFPEAVDLVAITAIDARTATVTAADRRSFATSDAGVTWIRK